MMQYVRPYRRRTVLAIIFCCMSSSMDAFIAWSLKSYTDMVIVAKTVHAALYIPFCIVGFAVIQGTLNYFATYLNAWVSWKISNDMKLKLYKKLLGLETSCFDNTSSGEVILRFNKDVDTASNGALTKLKTAVSRTAASVSLICVLVCNSWKLAIIAIITFGLSFIPISKIRKKMQAAINETVIADSQVISVYNESYDGNRTIAAYNLAEHQAKKLWSVLKNVFRINMKIAQRTSWLSPTMHTVIAVGAGISVAYGSHLIVTNQITSGNFVSFIVALVALYNPIKNIGNSFKEFKTSLMAIDRITELLAVEPTIKEKADAAAFHDLRDGISFADVCFEYKTDVPVLQHISLDVKKGETLAIVGNSGGGKTTLMNLLLRLYDVTAGTIRIDGTDIREYTLESLREGIAVVFQDNFIFAGTIRDNIAVGKQCATDSEIWDAIKIANLEEFVSGLDGGINAEVGERGVMLSGGQKQRIAIARAAIKNSPIIILDEATSALDNKSEAYVQKALDNIVVDKTVFVIAHRLSTMRHADKIAVINNGKLVELGSHDELMQISNGQYKTLYDMQFRDTR
ncbi:MAG: ABC transporter ATP-binding protein/permease [Holosporales bacterium]|nr:ABC transporter ATP-binding protein/permease [Holosporales bacterium]